jgi:phenylalanyl-tRNA synthetase beta chain
MQFSELWLKELLGFEIETSTLRDQLISMGLEVESITPVADFFSEVVVGEVEAKVQHPAADRLNVCSVNVGEPSPLQIVCGAKNVAVGQKVPVARVGAKLPGNFEIKKAALRGVESCGMICSSKELGFPDDGLDGIWVLPNGAPIGQDFREYLQLNDHLITLGITPNRGDCLSMVGIAREIAAANGQKFVIPSIDPVSPVITDKLSVAVNAPESCPVYLSRVVRGLSKDAQSPAWLVERLRRCGAKSIHPAVDITNYIMYFLGQPMHVFDLEKIEGSLKIGHLSDAQLSAGAELTLLDGSTKKLLTNTLLISDDREPLALGGVMGGMSSSVTSETMDIVFEAAHFVPAAVAGFSRKYGVSTNSAHQFERGVDPILPQKAIELATQLLISMCGGRPGPVVEVSTNLRMQEKQITVALDRVKKRLGIPSLEMDWVLKKLDLIDLSPIQKDENTFVVKVPSHRFDLQIQEDIAEEVARMYGLNHIEPILPSIRPVLDDLPESHYTHENIVDFLVNRGFMQTIHYSFIDPKWQKTFYSEKSSPTLKNPIASDMAQMRGSLLPGLISSVVHNLNRQINRIHFFEMGRVFCDEETEVDQLACVKVGLKDKAHWSGSPLVDFFDLKGDVEALFKSLRKKVLFVPLRQEIPYLHPKQSAELLCEGKRVGVMGALHPAVQKELDIKQPVFLMECEKSVLLTRRIPAFKEISKYPSIKRDLALVVDQATFVSDIVDACKKTLGSLLIESNVFDIYAGKNIDPGKKSVALSFTLQDLNKTLVEEEINEAIKKTLNALQIKFDAKLRG